MRRFLFTVWPFTGHIHPSLAVARALCRDGSDVAFYTGEAARDAVEREGFRWFPLRAIDEAAIARLVLSTDGLMAPNLQPWRARRLWRDWVLGSIPGQLRDLDDILRVWPPDVIVCDPTVWAPFLVLHELRRIPVAILSLIPACHVSGVDGPIIGFPRRRPRGPLERLLGRALRRISDAALRQVRAEARRVRMMHGLAPFEGSVTDFAGRMPLYLVPGSADFDYSRTDLPPSVHYVGPCLLGDPPAPCVRRPRARPAVYVSEGTVTLNPRLLRAAVQGLAHLPVDVIVTTGRHRAPEELDLGPRPFAPNIRVERWVPLMELLADLDAIVTVGGPSTLMAGLAAGIPAVVVPFTWDHPETAWRVHESGAGIRLPPGHCTPDGLRRAVQQVLGDPRFRANASRVAAELRAAGGPARAAELLARLAAESTFRGAVAAVPPQSKRPPVSAVGVRG